MLRVNIIGPGRVGQTFMRLLAPLEGVELGDIAGRSPGRAAAAAQAAGAGTPAPLDGMRAADLWLLTVPDGQITAVAEALAALPLPPAAAVHCSGFLSSEALAPLAAKGWDTASCHPVRSFADPAEAARQFAGTYCGLEGTGAALSTIRGLIEALGGQPFAVNSGKKALYHAAAVISNNFTVVLQALALETWEEAGVDAATARALCATLLEGTARNVAQLGPAAALTGPAARGDTEVMARQEAALAAWHPEAGALYGRLSAMATQLKQSGRTGGS